MAVSVRKARTHEILKQHETAQHRITGGLPIEAVDQVVRLEGLARETVRVLRENKTLCVREEQEEAVLLLGGRAADSQTLDLGYSEVKAEIDQAITTILNDKAELRELRAMLSSTAKAKSTQSWAGSSTAAGANAKVIEKIERLAELHAAGLLSAEEFSAAKARLL